MAEQDCELCNILTNEKFRVIYEDKYCFCCANNVPLLDGHIIILPKRHIETFDELEEKESKSMFEMIEKLALALQQAYNIPIIGWLQSKSYRTQHHTHIHLMPSRESMRKILSEYFKVPVRELAINQKLEETTEKIKQYIRG